MTLFDLLYRLNKDTTICIVDLTHYKPGKNAFGAKRKAGKVSVQDIQRIGNFEVIDVSVNDKGCVFIRISDTMSTKIRLATSDSLRIHDKHKGAI